MKQRFRVITQVSLAVLLALTLGLITVVPSIAQGSAQESASISPATEVYDLDNPPDFIQTSITWGGARNIERITDDERDLTRGVNNDYVVLQNTLFILTDYLEANLKEDGDKLELAIEFDDGGPARFTIVAFETIPTANPAAYDLLAPADVEITIKRHTVTEVVSIVDDDGYLLEERGWGRRGDYSVSVLDGTLTIFKRYLEGKLTTEGDTLVLTIKFDVGAITFTIKAVDRAPSIAPERADYDLDNPANATTTITWGDAIEVVSITENNDVLTPEDHYTVGQTINDKATLTILNDYLSDQLTDVDQSVELSIRFGFNSTIYPDLQHYATFNITAIGTYPTISPVVAPYDRRSKAAVNTTITWRGAKSIVSVADDGYQLQKHDDYSVTTIDADRDTLTILNSYLAPNLTATGDSLALVIEFDFGEPVTFTITAVDDDPSIDPQRADYDLDPDKRGDVATNITWQSPIQVVSITENGHELHRRTDYTVGDTVGDEATLTILEDYLATKLTDIDDEAVLTIEFSVGKSVTFTITGVRYPAVNPTEALYNLDDRADFIETRITRGSASNITRIIEHIADHERGLRPSLNNDYNDYIVLGDTLVITDNYLRRLDIGQVAVLSIYFDDNYTADFVIRVIGTSATIDPMRAVYDLQYRADVQTTITWNSATKVVSITGNDTENDNGLILGEDYVVGRTVDGKATLNITKAYLEKKVVRWVDEVLLAVEFDAGEDVQLSIGGLAGCFIATAAYDTAMAQEIEVLREFRDGYLLTNSLGQAVVDLYYRISPPIAEFITEHPSLKPVVRVGLLPAVAMSAVVVNTTAAEQMTVVGLLVLVWMALAVWAARRRRRGSEYT